VDSSLLIDEIIGGGDGLSYKARKGQRRRKSSFKERVFKFLGFAHKLPEPVDPNTPAPPLSREEIDMKAMDIYYTNYNWELPNQQPMVQPPTSKDKDKRDRTPSATAVTSVLTNNSVVSVNEDLSKSNQKKENSIIPECPLEEEIAENGSQGESFVPRSSIEEGSENQECKENTPYEPLLDSTHQALSREDLKDDFLNRAKGENPSLKLVENTYSLTSDLGEEKNPVANTALNQPIRVNSGLLEGEKNLGR
jgi:hypothetical protein